MKTPIETPLSDLIEACVTDPSQQRIDAFMAKFRQSQIGVVVAAAAPMTAGPQIATADAPISIALTRHTDGKQLVLAFADPEANLRKFGNRFNASMLGDAILSAAFVMPGCEGVMVHSGAGNTNVVINRIMAESPKQQE